MKMPLQSLICGVLVILRQEMPELPSHDSHEEAARIPGTDNPSMLGSGDEFEPVGFGPTHQVESHGFLVEVEEPPGVFEVRLDHVTERRGIFFPLPIRI